MQKSTTLDWDDLRFITALAEHGSLSRTARALGVDHTTVGRHVDTAEQALGVRLFTRSQSGYALTQDGARLLPSLRQVATAVHTVLREAQAAEGEVSGLLRVTAPETIGMTWLSSALARFVETHPAVRVIIDPTGNVANLSRGEAEVALRNVQSTGLRLVAQRVAQVTFGLYASPAYLQTHPIGPRLELATHQVLAPPPTPSCVETRWLQQMAPGHQATLMSELSVCLATAAAAGAGIAILPRFIGEPDPALVRLDAGEAPTESLWLTVHEDARRIPRVRALTTYLRSEFARAPVGWFK